MVQSIPQIERFQVDRGLDKKEYYAINEHINIVEELFESIGFDVPKEHRPKLELEWMDFTTSMVDKNIATRDMSNKEPVTDVAKADAYADVIVFAVGALLKLGFRPEAVLLEVGKEINSREGSMVNGKFEKDLSDEAKAKWYKADFTNCKRTTNG